jgi:hypothetical protein
MCARAGGSLVRSVQGRQNMDSGLVLAVLAVSGGLVAWRLSKELRTGYAWWQWRQARRKRR